MVDIFETALMNISLVPAAIRPVASGMPAVVMKMSLLPAARNMSSMQRRASSKLPMLRTGAVPGWTATVASSGCEAHPESSATTAAAA